MKDEFSVVKATQSVVLGYVVYQTNTNTIPKIAKIVLSVSRHGTFTEIHHILSQEAKLRLIEIPKYLIKQPTST